MNVYKKIRLVKSLYKITVVLLLIACCVCYKVGRTGGYIDGMHASEEICID